MGLYLNMAVIVHEWLTRYSQGAGSALTLGVQHLGFPRDAFARSVDVDLSHARDGMDAPLFFAACGYSSLSALDVSDYEGATIIHDLNDAEPPPATREAFDLVFNGGTLEHVFDVASALACMTGMVKPGGLLMHASPTNNWVDHGFYQISPTLYFDHATAAGLRVLEAAALLYSDRGDRPRAWEVRPLQPGSFGAGLSGALDDRTVQILMLARKESSSPSPLRITQSLYAEAGSPQKPAWFEPFDIEDGLRRLRDPAVRMRVQRFVHDEGHCWLADVPLPRGDALDDALRSQAVIFEDGSPLGPGHAPHKLIRERGRGAYSHWEGMLMMSSSDNSDPNTNGRAYEVVIPSPSRD